MATTGLSDPLVGRVLDGRYRVDAVLARGGMATVYTAADTRLDRVVAVKVMHPALAEDQDFVDRFRQEAKSAARIASPHVVAVTDAGSDAGLAFLVMELVRGRSLREVLRERGRLRPADALQVLEPVAQALAAAHAAGLVHRDIKPENVLLGDNGQIKVTDFGLARAIAASPLTAQAGLLLGTVAYLAPEQVASGAADERTDVYAAGVMLFEMLTGHPPFAADTPLAVAYKHVHESVPRPGSQVAGIPEAVDELTLAMTERDPAERPADGAALSALVARVSRQIAMSAATQSDTRMIAIPDAAATTPIPVTRGSAPPLLPTQPGPTPPGPTPPGPTPPGQGGRPRRRRRRAIAVLLLLGLTAGAALAGWWFGEGRYRSVPSLLGDTVASAKAAAAADHVSVVIAGGRVYSASYPAGEVAEQTPGPHSRMLRGGKLTLIVSRGPRTSLIPAVRGAPLATAEQALRGAHLLVGALTYAYSDVIRAGDVVSSDPGSADVADQGTAVALVVSKGPAPVRMPDVRGEAGASAQSQLEAAGLTVTTSEAYSTSVTAGDVVSQSVPAGQTVPHGSAVRLVVSKGPQFVTLPRLDGESPALAEAQLNALGLYWKIEKFPGTPSRDVVGTSPDAGTSVQVGSTITLYVF
jgi:serine/threonine-protein kinase